MPSILFLFIQMANGDAAADIVSSFPPPPPFYKQFANGTGPSPSPPPPVQGTYTSFGVTYTTEDCIPSLEEQGRTQLFPPGDSVDHVAELCRLNRSLLFNFLDLVKALCHAPAGAQHKIDDIELVFLNFHHLLNCYRPHQARQILVEAMEDQARRKNRMIQSIEQAFQRVREIAQEATRELEARDDSPITNDGEQYTTSGKEGDERKITHPVEGLSNTRVVLLSERMRDALEVIMRE